MKMNHDPLDGSAGFPGVLVLFMIGICALASCSEANAAEGDKPYTYDETVCKKLEEKIEDRIFLVINEALKSRTTYLGAMKQQLNETREVYEELCLGGFDYVERPK